MRTRTKDYLRRVARAASGAAAAVGLDLGPDPYAGHTLVRGEPPPPAPGSFTVAVLPDTQFYSADYPATFAAQTRWLAEQKEARRIACALHLGDITHRDTPAEWGVASAAMSLLEGGGVPYAVCTGNHDYARGSCQSRDTLLNDYFPASRFRNQGTLGGTYDGEPGRMENSYHLFTAGGRDFLVLALEFGPRADVVRWAGGVAARHPAREVILVTHALVYADGERYDWAQYGPGQRWSPHSTPLAGLEGGVTDGEGLWAGLVSRHENFVLALCGHVLNSGLGRVTTATPGGRALPQVLVNFQMRPRGGDGWLRLLEFRAGGRDVEVWDYSPTLRRWNASTQNRFRLALPPVGTTAAIQAGTP